MSSKRNSHRFCATPGCKNIVSKKNRKKGAFCSACLEGQKDQIPVTGKDLGIVEEAAAEVTEHKPKPGLSEKLAALRKLVKGGEADEELGN